MQRRNVLAASCAALWVGVVGCAMPAPAPPALLLQLPPAALGRRLALSQQLRIWAGGHEFQFEALLEADAETLQLALLAFAQPVARLRWDGSSLTQHTAPGWPKAVSAERVLSDLVLALWPAAAVAAALPPDWSLQHDASSRELRWRGSVVQRVHYDEPQRVRLEHLVLGYRMQIDSQPLHQHATTP
jgi:hypothetical protein